MNEINSIEDVGKALIEQYNSATTDRERLLLKLIIHLVELAEVYKNRIISLENTVCRKDIRY